MSTEMNKSDNSDVPTILSEVTYLEMNTDPRIAPADLGKFSMVQVRDMSVADYLSQYREVGRDYLWNYRPGQKEDEIKLILNSPDTWMYLLVDGEKCIGMAEFDECG